MRMLIALSMIVAIGACSPTEPTPPAPVPGSVVTINIPGNPTCIVVNGNGCNVGTVPSPAPGSSGVNSVTIAEFGERTTDTCSNPAESRQRETRVGCVSDVTCNPRDKDGKVIFNLGVTGSSPARFRQLGGTGAGLFVQDDENGFNGTVTCKTTGVVVLECAVKDQASGVVVEMESPWTTDCVS